jgi:ATP-binding cassette subfamily B protein
LLPILAATVVDSATDGSLAGKWHWLALALVGSQLLSFVSGYFYRKTKDSILEKASVVRYARFLRQALELPYEVLVNRTRGDIVNKARVKADYIIEFINISYNLPRILFNTLLSVYVIATRSWMFAVAYIALWLPSVYLLYRVAKKRVGVNKRANEVWDKYLGDYSDIVSNADTVLQFGSVDAETKRMNTLGKKSWALYTERWRAGRQQVDLMGTIETLFNSAVFVFGLYMVSRGSITVGTYVLIQTYVGMALSDVDAVASMVRNFTENTVRSTSIDELENESTSLKEPASPVRAKKNDGSVVFENVSFYYSDKQDAVLENLSFEIKNGEKVGIVGRSGSGKTTITKLLLRLHEIHDGSIKIADVDIRKLGSKNARAHISYVPQDPVLFHRSIRDNITYNKKDVSELRLRDALKQSYVSEFIKDLQNGIQTVVGERGIKLSGGQRQRVAIARAIVKDAPILLFDEATSALDSESESVIQKALTNVMKNKTAIVIAHRLSTLKHMDRIIVLEKGKIIESGTHQELLSMEGHYASLWAHQSGGFIEE